LKTILLVLISSLLLMSLPSPKFPSLTKPVATCYGKNPCLACKNCKYCKLCNQGGKCGICSASKDKSTAPTVIQKQTHLHSVKQLPKKVQGAKEPLETLATVGNTNSIKTIANGM